MAAASIQIVRLAHAIHRTARKTPISRLRSVMDTGQRIHDAQNGNNDGNKYRKYVISNHWLVTPIT